MRNDTITEVLALDRQRRLEDAARRYRRVRELSAPRRTPLRAGAGLVLIRAGLRLARIDPVYGPTTLVGS